MKRILAKLILIFFFAIVVAPFVGQNSISKKEYVTTIEEESEVAITPRETMFVSQAYETNIEETNMIETEETTIEVETSVEGEPETIVEVEEIIPMEVETEETTIYEEINDNVILINSEQSFNDNEMYILYQIACAEAGDWDYQAVKNVVYVILNRVYSSEFPNSIEEVVFAKRQFSPISDGRYWSVVPNKLVYNAVNEAVNDYESSYKCYGALYFSCNGVQLGEALFTDSIGHTFFK